MLNSFSVPTTSRDKVESNRSLNMEVLAKKCIYDHRHPIVKVSLPGRKLFFAAKSDEERILIREHQDQFLSILGHQRVDKRSSRAQAIWQADKGYAKVTKVVKNLVKHFGYQNKEGIFLYPEEMLYLLETNRLEVTFIDTSLSIEKAYELVINTPDVNLNKYRAYKKLALLGYKLVRFEQVAFKVFHRLKKWEMKRPLEETNMDEPQEAKKFRQCNPLEVKENKLKTLGESSDLLANQPVGETSFTKLPKEADYILNVFEQLRQNMPRSCLNTTECNNPDYCVWSPTNTLKAEPDYNLFICEKDIIDRRNFRSNNIPNIYAICLDDVAFYKISDVLLPCI